MAHGAGVGGSECLDYRALVSSVQVGLGKYNQSMQKILVRVFTYTSIAFGIVGLLIVFTSSGPDHMDTIWDKLLAKLLFTCIFIILPSFALSVASIYLKEK
jgi:cell shape-determining protein MreD